MHSLVSSGELPALALAALSIRLLGDAAEAPDRGVRARALAGAIDALALARGAVREMVRELHAQGGLEMLERVRGDVALVVSALAEIENEALRIQGLDRS